MTVFPASPRARLIGVPYIEDEGARAADIRRRLRYLPEDAVIGLEKNAVPYAIKAKPYLAIRQQMINTLVGDYYSPREIKKRIPATNQFAYMAYLLFGTSSRLEYFLQKNIKEGGIPRNLRNIMMCFSFPEAKHWDVINFREWGRALLQYPGERTQNLFFKHSPYMNPEQSKGGGISLLKTEFRAAMRSQEKLHTPQKLEKIFDLAVRFDKNLDEFNRVLIAANAPKKVPTLALAQTLPNIILPGDLFGMEDCVFHKLSRHDPRILYIGDYDESCERVSDSPANLERNVVAATQSDLHAFYAVERYGEIIAHSWAYRGMSSELVFDGFESREENFNRYNLQCLLEALHNELDTKAGPMHDVDCNGIILGLCRDHLEPLREALPNYLFVKIRPHYLNGVGMTQKMMSIIAWPDERATYASQYLANKDREKRALNNQYPSPQTPPLRHLKNEI